MDDSEEIKKQAEELEKVGEAQRENLFITRDVNNEIREGLKLISKEKDLKNAVRKSLTALNKQAEFQVDIAKTTNKALTDTNGILKKQEDYSKALNSLRRENIQLSNSIKIQEKDLKDTKASMSKEEISAAEKQIALSKELNQGISNQIINQNDVQKVLDSQVEASKQIASLSSVSTFSFLSELSGAIPGMNSLTKGFDKAASASKDAAASMVKIDKKTGKVSKLNFFEKAQAGLKGLTAGAGELMKAFGPLAIAAKVIQGLLRADESTGTIAKGLNQSYEAAALTKKELQKIQNNSKDIFVTFEGLEEALLDINEAMGTSALISDKTLATFAKLEKTAGLTSEQLMGIGKLSFANGKELKGQTDEFLKQVKATKTKYGVSLNSKKILSDISKVSGATAISLGMSADEIARAVTTARALGMELESIENISDGLLDFESSITKELEAELLLGKNLNLEKARTAALNNDLATVAEEIANQAGSAADFAKMNRIQQQALAEAVGMSRSELGETLFVQEQLAGLSEEDAEKRQKVLDIAIAKHGVEEANKMLEEGKLSTLEAQASKQEAMAAAAANMNDAFMELGANLTPILEVMSSIAGFLSKNISLVMGIVAATKTYNLVLKAQKAIELVNLAIQKRKVGMGLADYVTSAASSAAKNPFIGPILAVAAGVAAYTAGTSMIQKAEQQDDVMLPGKNSGYGNRMISGPEGTFALNDKDTIIAGTKLDQDKNFQPPPNNEPSLKPTITNTSSKIGNNENIQRVSQTQPAIINNPPPQTNVSVDMSETNKLLNMILGKSGVVKIDSVEAGTAFAMGTYEVQ